MSESMVTTDSRQGRRGDRHEAAARRQAAMGDAEAGGRLRAGDGAAVHPLHLICRVPMQGRSVDEYRAPLFIAWQLTNRCSARCITCCEESGPDKAWRDELTRDEALDLAARDRRDAGIPYVAFGGGEPLGGPARFEIFELPRRRPASRSSSRPTAAASTKRPPTASRARHPVRADFRGRRHRGDPRARPPGIELRRSRSPPSSAWRARGSTPQFVFVPTRLNLHEIVPPTISPASSAAARS